MRFIFSATTHPIVNDPRYSDYTKTFLTPQDVKSDKELVAAEVDRLKNIIPTGQTSIVDENARTVDKALFLQRMNGALKILEQQQGVSDVLSSELVSGTGLTSGYKIGEIPEQSDAENKRELASLQRLIRERQENLAEIDGYLLRLLMGKPFQAFTATSKNKFVKVADDTDKEADKVTRRYFNELYEDSEGSPNYGDILENPEDYHHTLTTKASQDPKPQRFKKI
jgi:hypothetical protein